MSEPRIGQEELTAEARKLLGSISYGEMSSTAYDTAWVARLPSPTDPDVPMYPAAYDWLLQAQHADGSWGSDIPMPHDRVVSTLAALITLAQSSYRRSESELAYRRGIVYLNRERPNIREDPAETVGFELLLPEMTRQTQALNISLPYDDWTFIEAVKVDKLQRIPPIAVYGGPTPLTHSLEYLGDRLLPALATRCRFQDGSYGISPSATVFVHQKAPTSETAEYIERVARIDPTGGVPYVHPFEVFETAWVLHCLGPFVDGMPEANDLAERLVQSWSPMGLAWTAESTVTDADDTSVALLVLTRQGRTMDTGIFELFETADYFQTFVYERDPSVTTNAHILSALRLYPSTPERRRMIVKIVQYLRQAMVNGEHWQDKWHGSPYYATDEVVLALLGLADDLVRDAIQWLLVSQHENGAWGWGDGTVEETAWATHTLVAAAEADTGVRALAMDAIERGAAYLEDHFGEREHPAMWIGKSLYTPPNIVRAIMIGALWRRSKLVPDLP